MTAIYSENPSVFPSSDASIPPAPHVSTNNQIIRSIFLMTFTENPDLGLCLSDLIPHDISSSQMNSKGEFSISLSKAQETTIEKVGANGFSRAKGKNIKIRKEITGSVDSSTHTIHFDDDQLILSGNRFIPDLRLKSVQYIAKCDGREERVVLKAQVKVLGEETLTLNPDQFTQTISEISWIPSS